MSNAFEPDVNPDDLSAEMLDPANRLVHPLAAEPVGETYLDADGEPVVVLPEAHAARLVDELRKADEPRKDA